MDTRHGFGYVPPFQKMGTWVTGALPHDYSAITLKNEKGRRKGAPRVICVVSPESVQSLFDVAQGVFHFQVFGVGVFADQKLAHVVQHLLFAH